MKKFIKNCLVLATAAVLLTSVSACTLSKERNEPNMSTKETTKISLENQLLAMEEPENARQLGGYVGADGRKVKENVLIRTAGIDGISDKTAETLAEQYNIKQVIDFRMEYERAAASDKEIPGAENTWITVFEMDMSDPETIALMKKMKEAGENSLQKSIEYAKTGMLGRLYTDILLSEQGQKGYARFFDILLNNKDGAVLWHCTYGKDRTGIAAVLLLYALGVDESVIMQDFLFTNEVYKDKIELLQEELQKQNCDETVLNDVQAMAGVKGEYLEAALSAVKENYGSIHDYLNHQLGVSDEELKQLQDMYLE